MLEIFLESSLRLSGRVRVGAGAGAGAGTGADGGTGVWLSETSALVAHRRKATFQSQSVVQSDLLTKCPQHFSNSVSLAVKTLCPQAFQIFPISLDSMLMPASVQHLHSQNIGSCVSLHPATRSVSSPANILITVLTIAAAILVLASHLVAIPEYCSRLRDLSKDSRAISMTIQ